MCSNFVIHNAAELWQRETSLPSIPTFSKSLDNALGNDGIQLGSLTEILGLPGSGKTQLCLQLCASVQVPKTLGGLDASALYIDTNTNFTTHRFKQILYASLSKCQRILDVSLQISAESALSRLHYVNAFGLEKFCAFMATLPSFVHENPNVRLIVIDSIVFPFKEGITVKQRTGLLFRMMADLQRIAIENQIAVVLTNEMTTRVGLTAGAVVGALGDAWAHRCNTRLLVTADAGDRLALLMKSNTEPEAVARFKVVLTNEMKTRLGLSMGAVVVALGDAWAHRCNTRLLVTADAGDRLAPLMKSNTAPKAVARFNITQEGIRDIE